MLYEYNLRTTKETLYPISSYVHDAVEKSGIQSGIVIIYCPHTTAGITINENADPDVVSDVIFALNKTFPDRPEFQHAEGNSAAHLKAIAVGPSVTIPIERGRMILGTWQGIYFCEFDPPRNRTFYVKVMAEKTKI
ncbi:MAG: YjbQ family protein [Treponema sp.]|nr:YjbQ family protein [Treponema sp.]